jgi:hypothetical protein
MSNNDGSQTLNSSSLFDFTNVPDFLRATSDSLAIPSLSQTSTSNAVNSLESATFRGLRSDTSSSVLASPIDLNNSYNAGQSYWPAAKSTDSHKEFSLNFSKIALNSANFTLQLKPQPSYIERYTSFYTVAPLNELLDALSAVLSQSSVDFQLIREKAKFQCVLYDAANNCVQFLVKIYSTPQGTASGKESQKLVEFQRRFGCCVAYNRAYQQLYAGIKLSKTPYVAQFNNVPCEPNTLNGPLAALNTQQVVLDPSSLNSLCSMATSSDLCSAREALRCLSSCNLRETVKLQGNSAAELIISACVAAMNKNIKDDEQERCTAQIIAQLAEVAELRGNIVDKLLAALLTCLDSPITKSSLISSTGCLQSRCTKRYIAKAMAQLADSQAKLLKKLILNNQENFNILKKYEYVVDPAVSNNIRAVIVAIESA